MKLTKQNLKQWALLIALFIWGFASFLMLAAEDAPNDQPTPIMDIILIKVIALASFAACVLTGKFLDSKGLLPNVEE